MPDGRLPQRHQGRGRDRQPPARVGRRPRPGAVRQRRGAPRPSTRCRPPRWRSFPDFRRFLRAKARLLTVGRHCRPGSLVGPAGAGARRRRAVRLGTRPRPRSSEAFATYSPRLAAHARRGLRRRLGRRRAARRQAGRGLLHARAGRRLSRVLHELRRLASTACRPSPTSSATPTTTSTWPTAPPLQRRHADGPGRDRQHLLRDGHGRSGPGRRRRPPAASALLNVDLQGAAQVVVDIHSPLPVRVGAVHAGASSGRCRSPSCAR